MWYCRPLSGAKYQQNQQVKAFRHGPTKRHLQSRACIASPSFRRSLGCFLGYTCGFLGLKTSCPCWLVNLPQRIRAKLMVLKYHSVGIIIQNSLEHKLHPMESSNNMLESTHEISRLTLDTQHVPFQLVIMFPHVSRKT